MRHPREMQPLVDPVVDCAEPDGLRRFPVAAGTAGKGQQRAARGELELRGVDAHRHLDLGRRSAGQDDAVGTARPAFDDHRLVAGGDDQDFGNVVIDDIGGDRGDLDRIVGAAVTVGCSLAHGVLDVDRAQPLGDLILRRRDGNLLRHEPVVAVEHQRRAIGIAIQRHALAAGPDLGFARGRRLGGDVDVFFRRTRQDDGIDRMHKGSGGDSAALEDPQAHEVLAGDDDPGFVVVHDVDRDVRHVGAAGHAHVDQAAVALAVVADHRHRLAAFAAANVEGIAAAAADQFELDILAGAADEEGIVAFEGIDDDSLETREADEEPGTENALFIDDKVVAELGTDHGERIEAVATFDPDRGIDGIGNEIRPLPAVDVGQRCLRVVRVDPDEGADDEAVVVFLAVHREVGIVVVDGEAVVAGAAEKAARLVDAVAQIATRRQRGVEADPVLFGEAGIGIARRLEDLADLEGVVAGIAEDRRDDIVVIENEGVVAAAAVDHESAIEVAVVIHPLRRSRAGAIRRHRRNRVRAQEEGVRLLGSIQRQRVDAAVADRRSVLDVDPRRTVAGKTDDILVAVGLPLQPEFGPNVVFEGLGTAVGLEVDQHPVGPGAAFDAGDAADATDADVIVARPAIDEGTAGVRVGDVDLIGARPEGEAQVLDAGEHHAGPGHSEVGQRS